MALRPFLPTEADGIETYWSDDDGGSIVSVQNVAPLLDRAKALRNANDGYSPSRELRRVAYIPEILRQKIINEQGWDPYRPDLYPEKMARLLNDPDYVHLRTADGRIGVVNGKMR